MRAVEGHSRTQDKGSGTPFERPRFETLRYQILVRRRSFFVIAIRAHHHVIGIRPKMILVNRGGRKSELGQPACCFLSLLLALESADLKEHLRSCVSVARSSSLHSGIVRRATRRVRWYGRRSRRGLDRHEAAIWRNRSRWQSHRRMC